MASDLTQKHQESWTVHDNTAATVAASTRSKKTWESNLAVIISTIHITFKP
jgi:hypothetical protein